MRIVLPDNCSSPKRTGVWVETDSDGRPIRVESDRCVVPGRFLKMLELVDTNAEIITRQATEGDHQITELLCRRDCRFRNDN